jgi:hypothetical protein
MKFLPVPCLVPVCAVTALLWSGVAVHAQTESTTRRQSWNAWAESGWVRLHLESQGQFELTDDEQDVKSVAPGGTIELTSRGWLSLFGRRYIVRGNPDGTVTRRYLVGAAERPLDGNARSWISEAFQNLTQHGFGAEARMAKVLDKEGPTSAIQAASRISDDYIKAQYLITLARTTRFDDALLTTFTQVSAGIGSDYEKANVLIKVIETQAIDAPARTKLIEAAGTIGSDYERSRVLSMLAVH